MSSIKNMRILGYVAIKAMSRLPITFGRYKDRTYMEMLESKEGLSYLKWMSRLGDSSKSLPAKMVLKNKDKLLRDK